ncbi:MAG: hypothetical protein HUU01_14955 [Saprospiraceae bacterium]|nr:hypothetical protein [Saprospiraceae bacterium]
MWWVVLSLLLAAVFWVLWAPIRLEINTWKGIYRAKWVGFGALNWLPEEGVDVIEINLFFWKKRWALSEIDSKQLPAKTTPKTTAVKKKKRRNIPWRGIKKIAQTFKVRQCQFSFDTGNYLWNAWLFPVFWLWRSPNVSIWINFQGKNEGSLLVENRLGRLLWAMISSRVL